MARVSSEYHYHLAYYCGQESFRRNGIALIVNERVWNGVAIKVNKRVQNGVLGCSLKNDKIISVHFQGKLVNITVIQVYALTTNTEEDEAEQFCEDL